MVNRHTGQVLSKSAKNSSFPSTVVIFLPYGKSYFYPQAIPIGPYDVLIAPNALAAKATLITRNVKEFGRIEPLDIED